MGKMSGGGNGSSGDFANPDNLYGGNFAEMDTGEGEDGGGGMAKGALGIAKGAIKGLQDYQKQQQAINANARPVNIDVTPTPQLPPDFFNLPPILQQQIQQKQAPQNYMFGGR